MAPSLPPRLFRHLTNWWPPYRGAGIRVVAIAPEALAQLRAQQQELLHSYRLVDEKNGVVGIPIEDAMALVVAEASRGGSVGSQATARSR